MGALAMRSGAVTVAANDLAERHLSEQRLDAMAAIDEHGDVAPLDATDVVEVEDVGRVPLAAVHAWAVLGSADDGPLRRDQLLLVGR